MTIGSSILTVYLTTMMKPANRKAGTSGKRQTIRIIGGQYRRSLIPVADADGLRPTADRIRETLFNWLNHLWDGRFDDKSVLDLFAGTGALGFEAASRGAAHVQMAETNTAALACLRATRDKLQANQVRINSADAFLMLKRMDASRFDLVLLDPPFAGKLFDRLFPFLPAIVKPGGLVYIESDQPEDPGPDLPIIRQGKAGQVYYQLHEHLIAPHKSE